MDPSLKPHTNLNANTFYITVVVSIYPYHNFPLFESSIPVGT